MPCSPGMLVSKTEPGIVWWGGGGGGMVVLMVVFVGGVYLLPSS